MGASYRALCATQHLPHLPTQKREKFGIRRRLGGAQRNPTYIRMLALAKPPTPLATTRGTRTTQWLPNLQFFCNILA
ncbi:MAG: hypothetical protein V7L23_23510 [Nostoc sp.]|uniref:hypothetical protein n=1 Tax=Nostoc sp. TaxID=1180 RepID=UPI002FEFF64E